MSDELRFPLGEFDKNSDISPAQRAENIEIIRRLPNDVARAVESLSDAQLETHYRPGGWTLRQTVHHLADSHATAYTRFKLALTEDEPPVIRPYREDRWAELEDSLLPVDFSLGILEGIHTRWAALLSSLTDEQMQLAYIHPETGEWPIEKALGLYAWHSRHHTAHITRTRDAHGW